ncbi:MAG: lamin tail domain-containing protein, partial [bacterium]|nr:lamin tail domain-containing protein [bacterium]
AMHVVISEIAAGIDGNPDYEFIELYNPTTTTVELTGWSIKKKSSTGSESSLLVASRLEGKVILPNHYFLTANEEGYTGSLAPDIRWAKSNTLAYTNNAVTLYDASSARVDEASWIEIPKGKSWERKAVSGETCVSAQNAGEYLGNGCDTDSASDFEIRNTPNPQNAQSLPEPRAAAQIQNPSVSYSSSTMELVFNWGSSADAAGATSTVAYEIQEYNSPGVPIFNAMSTTGFRKLIDEVGREYHFSLQTFDREGLGSATSTLDVAIPSFMESAAWYENPAATGSYRLEARYGRYPFIPGIWQGPAQKIIVAYLNEAASKIPINLATRTGMQLNAATNPALFRYRNCVGSDTPTSLLFLPDNAEWCSGISGDVRLNALPFGELEDLHLHVDIHPRETPFTTTDYLTFAFYAGSDSFGGNQGFSLVAVDATKYFLNPEPPAHQPPSAPSDLELSATNNDFTGISGILASFTPSNDPDSLDWRLRYQWSTARSTWQTLDLGGGPDPNKKYGGVSLPMGNTYTISIRSVDETGLISPVVAQDITIPAAPPGCPAATGNAYYAIDCIRLHDGLVEIRWRLLTNSPVSGATFGINPYLSSTTPSYANRALHKDINGNSPYSNSTANAGGDCSRSFTPVEQYELNRQYRTTFPSIGVVPATDITATSTLKFAIFRGTPCLISDLFWDDPQEYAISTP